MGAAQEKAKYFCENCGSEVGAKARFCPKCGKFFSSVRCPNCGFTGDARTFKGGCPKCHYAMPSSELYGTETSDGSKKKLSRESKKKIRQAFSAQKKNSSANSASGGDDAPRWLYILSLIVLALIIVFLVIRCRP